MLLSPNDNVVVLTRSVPAGAIVRIEDQEFLIRDALGLGQKLAVRAIGVGEKIIKYGVSIGSATCAIEPGEHVHLHNIQSDYLPTFTLEQGREYHTTA